jgi:hypothetical protein
MADLDAQIRESRAQVAEARRAFGVTTRIRRPRAARMAQGTEIKLDIENANAEGTFRPHRG